MRTVLIVSGVIIAALGMSLHAHGQKATERYIPIGQSPGVSQKLTSIGEIADVDQLKRTVTLLGPAGQHTVSITDSTRIWLDRTKLKQTNLTGTFADLQKGRRIEVKYQDAQTRQVADWIKVEITQP